MWEVYLISISDAVCGLLLGILLLSLLGSIIFAAAYFIEDLKTKEMMKYSIIICIITSVLFVLIPNSKQATLIFGVGGTIDYIQDNETAKQLPDKAIRALDMYLESASEQQDNQK